MSDAGRIISGPPSRPNSGGGAGSLLRANRTAQQPVEPSRTVAPPPPAPRRAVQQTIASAPESEVEYPVMTVEPSEAPAVTFREPEPSTAAAEDVPPAVVEPAAGPAPQTPQQRQRQAAESAQGPTTPYTRRRYGDSGEENPDDIVKVTFEIRRGDRDAFNDAFAAASLHEGYTTPKDILVDIYLGETKRLQDTYNGGQPFPKRMKQAPRGRPIRREN
ncbi:hypothetical protein QF011_003576 [Curtobacterium flaccumfaciens]|nr:hypothetical protein [Curtobacterium flaccumfaciens]